MTTVTTAQADRYAKQLRQIKKMEILRQNILRHFEEAKQKGGEEQRQALIYIMTQEVAKLDTGEPVPAETLANAYAFDLMSAIEERAASFDDELDEDMKYADSLRKRLQKYDAAENAAGE